MANFGIGAPVKRREDARLLTGQGRYADNVNARVEGALTTTVPINVYRGVGRLECVYTVQRRVERAARETGRDPTALRRANMVRSFPYRTATVSGRPILSHRRPLRFGRLRRSPGRSAGRRRRRRLSRAPGRGPAAGQAPRARGRPLRGGHGRRPPGIRGGARLARRSRRGPHRRQSQGHETAFAQVVAERLGVAYEQVQIVMGDTDHVARGIGTFASRSTVRAGSAAVEAVDAVIATCKAMAAHLLEAATADVEYGEGAFRVVGKAIRGARSSPSCEGAQSEGPGV